ncbi:GntR family transcriptional regulator [Gaiella sp.]|uniref:GntR family transcriptional regulator n=1 Tax=Gaiella sp. TaxID=2663207 RepID=UPI002E306728|nr:GntR family transcriptional regulator [Gaiella sp.]HEX5582362.1 GntR family transcriptional regulator [Gaiella sp.]
MAQILGDDHPPLTRSAGEAAADVIRRAILDGTLFPGQRLTEEGLARDLKTSRTPVREALRVLKTEGLVVSTPYHGSTVRAYEIHDLDDMYQLRALLEGHAARRAAPRIDEEGVAKLRESTDRLVALGDATDENVAQIVSENVFFHTTILELAGSQRLAEMVRKVIELPLIYKSYHWYSPEQKRLSEHAHRQLVDVLSSGDGDRAELIMRGHVYDGRDVLLAHMQSLAEGADEGVGSP